MYLLKINLFGFAGSQLWHERSLVVAGKLLVMTCGIQFPAQESNPGTLHSEPKLRATGPPVKSPKPTFCCTTTPQKMPLFIDSCQCKWTDKSSLILALLNKSLWKRNDTHSYINSNTQKQCNTLFPSENFLSHSHRHYISL